MSSKQVVMQVGLKGLRRGDPILAIRYAGCGQREAGVSQKSRVLGMFVMRHKVDDEHTAVVWRHAETGEINGHESRYENNAVAFVLRPRDNGTEGGAA